MKSSCDAKRQVVTPGDGPVIPSVPLIGRLPMVQLKCGGGKVRRSYCSLSGLDNLPLTAHTCMPPCHKRLRSKAG